ncbi:MAG: PH domain-containing protein [Nitriliruptoraceae bacterium]
MSTQTDSIDADATGLDSPLDLDERERTLDRGVVTLWRLQAAAGWAVAGLVTATIGAMLATSARWLPAVVMAAVAATVIVIVPPWRFRRWRWRVTNQALELRYGIVVHRHIAVPYFRIQQIDVTRRPLERLAGLSALEVTTASASGTVRLPGLDERLAPALRTTLIERARAATAAFDGDGRDAV